MGSFALPQILSYSCQIRYRLDAVVACGGSVSFETFHRAGVKVPEKLGMAFPT